MQDDNDLLEEKKESSKKVVDTGAKAALDAYTGGVGGSILDFAKKAPGVGKAIDKAEENVANNLDRNTNGAFSNLAKKADDSGVLDAANMASSMKSGNPLSSSPSSGNNGKNILKNNQNIKNPEEKTLNNENNLKNTVDQNKIQNNLESFSRNLDNTLKDTIEEEKKEDTNKDNKLDSNETKNKESNSATEGLSELVKNKNTMTILIIGGAGVIFFLLIVVVFISIFGSLTNDDESDSKNRTSCSDISLTSTNLSKSEFISYVEGYVANSSKANAKIFAEKAGTIYDIAKQNDFNPEMVIIRANIEGYSPGVSYNYWGLGCSNNGGGKDCQKFSSFDQGVLGYINNIKGHGYQTLHDMMNKYAYIGSNWYYPGSAGQGGCYYKDSVAEFLSQSRLKEVELTCSVGSQIATTEEDQEAYTQFQMLRSFQEREKVFNITKTDCSEEDSFDDIGSGTGLGSKVAKYAVNTFDNYGYSQSNRMSNTHVDCSSLVWRSYQHFGVELGSYAPVAADLYKWCENNKKTIKGTKLKPGDIVFYNQGSHANPSRYKSIGHVELYIGNNQKFGAHTSNTAHENQVSITPYNGANYFCRPTK